MEFAIVLGGDGTVLSAKANSSCKDSNPYNQYWPSWFSCRSLLSNLNDAIDKLTLGEWDIERRTCLIISVMRNDQRRWESLA